MFGPKTLGFGISNLGNFGPLGYGNIGGVRLGSIGPLHFGHIGGIHADSFLGAPNPFADEDSSVGAPNPYAQEDFSVGAPISYTQEDSSLGAPNSNFQEEESLGSAGIPSGDSQYQEFIGNPLEQNWQELNDEQNIVGMEPNEEQMVIVLMNI